MEEEMGLTSVLPNNVHKILPIGIGQQAHISMGKFNRRVAAEYFKMAPLSINTSQTHFIYNASQGIYRPINIQNNT
jgi:hypothetical protein